MGKLVMTIADYDGEVSTVTFPGSDLTAVNFDAEQTEMQAVRAAMQNVQRGKELKYMWTVRTSPQGVGRADDSEAQREEKALVRYYDLVTYQRATLEIPCVDMTTQLSGHPGVFYIDGTGTPDAVWSALVTAFEAYVPGPGGNTARIEEIIHVGRNT